jgi:Carboxypeptidase regulatory-like domain
MRRISPSMASAVGGLILLAVPAAGAQRAPATGVSIIPVASLEVQTPGTISGVVRDEHGAPVPGAMVSVLGPSTAFALTGPDGRFELASLPPGPYLVRVHVAGFTPLRGEILEVRAGAHVASQLAIHRVPEDAAASPSILAAGVGGAAAADTPASGTDAAAPGDTAKSPPDEDEIAWRLRHARRSILKDGDVPVAVVASAGQGGNGREGALGRAVESPIRAATDLFSMPFTREVNLLTASSFNDPSQLFQGDAVAHGIAYVSLGAPAGRYADWTVRGAMTQGDLASWIVAGSYLTRPDTPGRHHYDVRLSYSTERYDGGNPEALRAVSDGSRNVGTVAGYDTFTINKTLSIDYGARYAHFDYLDGRSLISPRVGVTVAPTNRFRVTTVLLRRALAPGAEEFAPPMEGGIYLPPQRTFSSLASDNRLRAEQTTGLDVGVEHDLGDDSSVTAHAYRQHVDNELATLFGVSLPDQPASDLGHYFVAGAGNVDVDGWSAGFRTAMSDRVRGSVEYSSSVAHWQPGTDTAYLVLLAPSAVRNGTERIQDLSTTIETDMPETATRILVLYRLSNGFSRSDGMDEPALDSRFDVQVRQSLPFMDFSTAKWEMLVGVRNFFRDPAPGQSVYDELLVVRPPKRIVGGLTVRF